MEYSSPDEFAYECTLLYPPCLLWAQSVHCWYCCQSYLNYNDVDNWSLATLRLLLSPGLWHRSIEASPTPAQSCGRQFRLWPGPATTCTCPQSPQLINPAPSQLQEHLSVQTSHDTEFRKPEQRWTHGWRNCEERFQLFFLVFFSGTQMWFQPLLCLWATHWCLS